MLEKVRTIIAVSLFLILPSAAFGEVLFSDTFDDKPDWSAPYTSADQLCNKETGCTDLPSGYYGYYISRSVISPATGHGLHLDNSNKRGSSGKGLTFWDQTNGTATWTSGMQLGVDFAPQREVYVRYWIKMQPGYAYYKGADGSMMRKINHISHYVYNGKPFTFFSDGGHHPTTVNQLRFGNANQANLQNLFFIRPDTNYSGQQPTTIATTPLSIRDSAGVGVYNYFDLPDDSVAKGNYNGTGTEYNSPGMIADGKWHCLEFYLKNNSAPGAADGAYKFWLDGVVQIDSTGLLYRDASSNLPDDIWNFVHIGGNTINPFRGTGVSGEQWFSVDDVVISTSYSGPPPKPVSVKATSVSDSAIKVTWAAGNNNTTYPLDGYRVRYGTDPANLSETVSVGNVAEAEVTNLSAGKTYYFSVSGFNKGAGDANENESLRSLTVSAATAAAATVLPADTIAPVAVISNPANGSVSSGTVTVNVAATDNVGVSKVELYLNGSIFGVLGSAPYTVTWNTTNYPNGLYTMAAKAYDAAGNIGQGSTSFSINNTVADVSTPVPAPAPSPVDTTAPTAAVTSPAYGTTVSGTAAVTASASDNVAVTKVEFYVSGNLRGTATTAPYSFNWNTSALAAGPYTMKAKAYDAAGNSTLSSGVTLYVKNDTTVPTVSITSPTSGTAVRGTVPVTVAASDDVAVSKVEFYVNGVLKSTSTAAPYSFSWNTLTTANGAYTLSAKAYDAAGNIGTYPGMSVNVANDTTAPTVSITSPAAGSQIRGTVSVAASASDNIAVSKVEFYVNSVLSGTSASAPYSFSWNTLTTANGAYTLSAKAYDAAGNVGSYPGLTVNVANDVIAPTVAITSPAAGSQVRGTVSVAAAASDNVAVSKVEFYVNGVLSGTSTAAPYSFSWNTAASANGPYSLLAKAYDAAGNVGQSSTAAVTVANDTTAPTVYLTSPKYGSTLSGTVTVTANASDNIAVSKVEFYANSILIGTSTSAPWNLSWNTQAVANGTYNVSAKAYDAAGNVGVAATKPVTVSNDTTAPVVQLLAPTASTLTGSSLTIKGSATDNVGVTKVEVYVDGVLSLATNSSTFSVKKTVTIGSHTIMVKAYDAAKNVASVTKTVNRLS